MLDLPQVDALVNEKVLLVAGCIGEFEEQRKRQAVIVKAGANAKR